MGGTLRRSAGCWIVDYSHNNVLRRDRFFKAIDARKMTFIGVDVQRPRYPDIEEIIMKNINSAIAAAVIATFAVGATAAYAPDEGTPYNLIAAHQQDEGTPRNLIAAFTHQQDEGTPRDLVAQHRQDEGTPQNLIAAFTHQQDEGTPRDLVALQQDEGTPQNLVG